MAFCGGVAGTTGTINKEWGHGDVWRAAAFISAGTSSVDYYPKAGP